MRRVTALLAIGLSLAAQTADASPLRLRFLHKGTAIAALPELVPANYSQMFGPTDADGWVTLPLRTTGSAKRVWVDTVLGNDTTCNGFSPYADAKLNGTGTEGQYNATGPGVNGAVDGAGKHYCPKATLAAATALIPTVTPSASVSGEGWQVFLREGQTFGDISTQYRVLSGYSTTYPTAFQSYPGDDPLNEAKHGRASVANMPIMKPASGNFFGMVGQTSNTYVGRIAWRGIHFVPADGSTFSSLNILDPANYLLFEGVWFDRVILNVSDTNLAGLAHILLRHFLSTDQYAIPGSTGENGFHTGNVDDLIVEDSAFINNGFNVLNPDGRNAASNAGGPSIFRHSVYDSPGSLDQHLYRRNVFLEGSATSYSGRGRTWLYYNASFNSPIHYIAGGAVNNYQLENPNGDLQTVDFNLGVNGNDLYLSKLRVSAQPADGDTFSIAGSVTTNYTWRTSPATPTDIAIGADVAATRANTLARMAADYPGIQAYASGDTIYQKRTIGVHLVDFKTTGTPAWGSADRGGARGYAYSWQNSVAGSRIMGNLLTPSDTYGNSNSFGILFDTTKDVDIFASVVGNRFYGYTNRFNNPAGAASATNFPTRRKETYSDNVNSGTSPATNLQLYAAIAALAGKTFDLTSESTAYASFNAAVRADPMRPWARYSLTAASTLWGKSFAYDDTQPTISGVPVISGVAQVGQTLTVTLPPVQAGQIITDDRWVRSRVEIGGTADALSYTLTADDQGKPISFVLAVVGANGIAKYVRSAPTDPVAAP